MSVDRGVDKEDVAHTYNGILLSHAKERTESSAETWMDLETVIQSEVSQIEKNRYVLMHIGGL